jgi:hypothetical protein
MSKREAESLKKGDLLVINGKAYEFQFFGGYNLYVRSKESSFGMWLGWRDVEIPTELIKALW